jgi:hypothetical protein
MFDFSNISQNQTQKLIDGFTALTCVPEVLAFEWGTERNKEDSPMGFSHCFILTFEDFDSRTRYLNSHEHREYEQEVVKFRNKVLVFDYEVTSLAKRGSNT